MIFVGGLERSRWSTWDSGILAVECGEYFMDGEEGKLKRCNTRPRGRRGAYKALDGGFWKRKRCIDIR